MGCGINMELWCCFYFVCFFMSFGSDDLVGVFIYIYYIDFFVFKNGQI